MHEPSEVSAEDWRLTVGGEVETPFALTLAELLRIEKHSVVNTLKCAGNGRGRQRPQFSGIQWGRGAVSTRGSPVRATGCPAARRVKAAGKHAMFRGLDEVPGMVCLGLLDSLSTLFALRVPDIRL